MGFLSGIQREASFTGHTMIPQNVVRPAGSDIRVKPISNGEVSCFCINLNAQEILYSAVVGGIAKRLRDDD